MICFETENDPHASSSLYPYSTVCLSGIKSSIPCTQMESTIAMIHFLMHVEISRVKSKNY